MATRAHRWSRNGSVHLQDTSAPLSATPDGGPNRITSSRTARGLPFAVIRTPTDRAGALRTWFAGCIATTAPSPIFRPPHDAASPLVPGDGDANMVRACPLGRQLRFPV